MTCKSSAEYLPASCESKAGQFADMWAAERGAYAYERHQATELDLALSHLLDTAQVTLAREAHDELGRRRRLLERRRVEVRELVDLHGDKVSVRDTPCSMKETYEIQREADRKVLPPLQALALVPPAVEQLKVDRVHSSFPALDEARESSVLAADVTPGPVVAEAYRARCRKSGRCERSAGGHERKVEDVAAGRGNDEKGDGERPRLGPRQDDELGQERRRERRRREERRQERREVLRQVGAQRTQCGWCAASRTLLAT
mgnify:CR=1 FL=1